MSQKNLAFLLKLIGFSIGLMGLVAYFIVLPNLGSHWSKEWDLESFYRPWLLFLWGTGIPCYGALFEFWKICGEIQKDNSFCKENALRLKRISILALGDVGYFFAGNIVMLLLNMNHPGIILLSFAIDMVGAAIGITAAALSHLVYKAAAIKEENDLTI